MQPIQKFSDFQSKKNEAAQAVKEADLQKEYGDVFTSLLKKYGVSSPADLDDAKKKEFFDEIGDHYTAGEGPTAKGEELVKAEEAPVKEEADDEDEEGDGHGEGEEDKDEEEIINSVASLESEEENPAEAPEEEKKEEEEEVEETPAETPAEAPEEEEVEEDAAEDIEKEKVEQGEPETAEGDVEKQPEEVEAAAEVEDDPEAGKAAELAPDEDTAVDIEKEKVEAGKPEKVVMDFDSFVKKNFTPQD